MLMVSNHVEFVKRQTEFNRRQYERLLSKSNLQDNTADLWFDTELLAERARERLARHIAFLTATAMFELIEDFAEARERCGV